MKTIKQISNLRIEISGFNTGKTGFVPTMGYLHEGHEELIKKSISENQFTIVSIFVNPAQFGEGEDFKEYPRDFERDVHILNSLGVDLLFLPDRSEIYPEGFKTYVNVEELDKVLCGRSRPDHFKGVTTIVLKLMNIISPDHIYLGRKDAQQLILLKRMIEDLNIKTEIRGVNIVREKNGLALSSRNSNLTPTGKKSALVLSESLVIAKNEILEKNIRDAKSIKKKITDHILSEGNVEIDYVEIVSLSDLKRIGDIDLENTLVACAVRVEGIRLIDNFILGEL